MLRSSEDTVFEYDPELGNNSGDQKSTKETDNQIKNMQESTSRSDKQSILGEVLKTDYLKLIQSVASEKNIKVGRLAPPNISTESYQGALTRIKVDLDEIKETIETTQKIIDKDEEISQTTLFSNPDILLGEIEQLKNQLNILASKQASFSNQLPSSDSLKQQTISFKDIINELLHCANTLKSTKYLQNNSDNTTNIDELNKENNENLTEVSIVCVGDNNSSLNLKDLVDLERRISLIESYLGIDQLSTMPYSDIQSAINDMTQKLSLLDSNRLEGIFRRVQALSSSIEQLNKKRRDLNDKLFDETDSTRITKLYDILQQWKSSGAILPFILERLKLLQIFHQDMAQINSRIAVMESQQCDIEKILETCKLSFEKLNNTISLACKQLQNIQNIN
ncbi:uncharacterized protein CMU_006710 [Cryptosporidium muris RN66]|uniref:Uncharacterized protein n=1 Tax=Cryptosporidium muris (strain RN66) TaxID=441375 RepID=B6AHQ3_CRYMR|nr:uncharacterized protein CMU_006710 [Cryptosporidium muris RN66]EEA07748.1 hypothetical protein CMU_006710 [Cryptosporidium muris RN66]|eukprot:XP_002142097.1 hypothetical protein [Cryptosporidium muris RN66]